MESCYVGAMIFHLIHNYPLAIFLYKQLHLMGHYLNDSFSKYKLRVDHYIIWRVYMDLLNVPMNNNDTK